MSAESIQDGGIASTRRLPNELHSFIIQELPLKTLLKVACVCREFQLEAEVQIYQNIRINDRWEEGSQFPILKASLLSSPRRQALVRELDLEDVCTMLEEVYVAFINFLLPTLGNIKVFKVPRWYDLARDSPFFKASSRFEELHLKDVELGPPYFGFITTQPQPHTLSCRNCVLSHDIDFDNCLPNLQAVEGDAYNIARFIPGRPICKVAVVDPPNDDDLDLTFVTSSLRQSTATITHLRLYLVFLSPTKLAEIANAVPNLEVLDIDEPFGDVRDDSPLSMNLDWMPDGSQNLIHYVRFKKYTRECLWFTPLVVDTLFAPLSQLTCLRTFTFKYTNLYSQGRLGFKEFDLSEVLKWRDTATPHLRSLQINHMKLTKDSTGGWVQGEVELPYFSSTTPS